MKNTEWERYNPTPVKKKEVTIMSNIDEKIKVRGYLSKRTSTKKGKPYSYYYVQLVYTDDDGNEKRETRSIGQVTKKSEAKEEMERIISEKREELGILKSAGDDGNRIIFIDRFRSWLESKKKTVEINTYDGYVIRSKAIIGYFEKLTEARGVDAIFLDEIKASDILDFYRHELNSGKVNKKTGEVSGLSRDTVLSYSGLLHSFYKDMVENDTVPENICDKVSIPRARKINIKKKNYFKMEQLKELMAVSENFRDKRLIPIIKICVTYGCRRSEVLGLKWDAIDFDNGTVEIKNTVVRGNNATYYKENTKSESSHRMYPMTAPIRKSLLELERIQKEKGCHRPDGIVFWDTENNKPYSPDYMSKLFKKIIKLCPNIPDDYHFHDMRKTCTTLLFETGEWDLKEILLWIGHENDEDKSYKTLLANYLTISMPWKRRKVPMIENLFRGIF